MHGGGSRGWTDTYNHAAYGRDVINKQLIQQTNMSQSVHVVAAAAATEEVCVLNKENNGVIFTLLERSTKYSLIT